MESGAFSYDARYKAAAQVLDGDDHPDAVMASSDEVALGLIDGPRTGSLDMPGDVLVTDFDGLTQASWAGYDLTTLVQPIEVKASTSSPRCASSTGRHRDALAKRERRWGQHQPQPLLIFMSPMSAVRWTSSAWSSITAA